MTLGESSNGGLLAAGGATAAGWREKGSPEMPAESKRVETTEDDWHAMRLRSDGGRPEYSGTDHREDGRFRAWGTLALFRCGHAPLAAEQVGVVEEAGPGGFYMAMHQPPPAGTLLRMRIYCQAGPPGLSVVEAAGRVSWCQPRGAGVQILDFADGEQGRQAWLALVRQPSPPVAVTAPPARVLPRLLGMASRRPAATGPAAGKHWQRWKRSSHR